MTIDSDTLEPGEKLLWQGGPDVKAYCERKAPIGFRAGLMLLAIAAACAAFQYFLQANTNSVAQLLTASLCVIAAILLYFPLRVWRIARRTEYAVTDRRAIIQEPGLLARNRLSVPLSEVRRIEVQNQNPGDVLFRDFVGQSEHGLYFIRDGFFAIPNAETVERLLRSAVEKFRPLRRPHDH